jgi:Tol biopolymer transport system component
MTILPQLEKDLYEAAQKRLPTVDDPALAPGRHDHAETAPALRWQRFRSRLRSITSRLPLLVSIAVTVVIGVVALTTLGHHHRASTAVSPGAGGVATTNGQIALLGSTEGTGYGTTRLENGKLWGIDAVELVNPDGSGRRYAGAYRCAAPSDACGIDSFAWSADGTQLAYLAGHPAGPNAPTGLALYVVGTSGKPQRMLAACGVCTGPSLDDAVSWSPDGSQIAVARYVGKAWNIWVVNVATDTLRRVTDCSARKRCADTTPKWSPDGQAILFSQRVKGRLMSLHTVSPDGSHPTQITAVAGLGDERYSPDGRAIAFDTPSGIYTVNADGTHLTHLLAAGTHAYSPSWSPDGTKLVYLSPSRAGNQLTWVSTINANGSDNRRLFQGASPAGGWPTPSWSPDGKQIVVSTNAGVYVMKANGTGRHSIGPGVNEVDWQPVP